MMNIFYLSKTKLQEDPKYILWINTKILSSYMYVFYFVFVGMYMYISKSDQFE